MDLSPIPQNERLLLSELFNLYKRIVIKVMKLQGLKETFLNSLSEKGRVIAASIFVGAMAGLATFLLKSAISWVGYEITQRMNIAEGNYLFLIFPVFAILCAALYQYLIKDNLEHGTEQLKHRLSTRNYKFKFSHIFRPLIGCFLTVGLGGSAGAEGPSAFSGSAIGDRTARWFCLSPYATRILFGCGAAAGIAGIFKSPVGGIMFAVEILRMELTVLGIMAVTCASLTAFSVGYILSGFTWNVTLIHPQQFVPEHLWWVALLGIICGLYSIYYDYSENLAGKFFKSIKNRWIRALICGGMLAIVIFLLPSMFGEGYDVVAHIVNGDKTPLLTFSPFFKYALDPKFLITGLAAVLLLKGAAVGATNSGGGVAGEFAPTIFAGCLMGFLFALLANKFLGADILPEDFALIGTAAVMSGTLRAPIMAIFIAAEISNRYNFILAFIVAAALSYFVSTGVKKLLRSN